MLPYVLGAGDWVRILGARWTSGDQANTDHDEGDTGPALRANVLMQPKDGEQCHDDVADGGRRHNVGEVGKGESGHVAGHEGKKTNDSDEDERIGKSGEDVDNMVNVYGADMLHSACEEGISKGTEERDGKNNEILAKGQSGFPVRGRINVHCNRVRRRTQTGEF